MSRHARRHEPTDELSYTHADPRLNYQLAIGMRNDDTVLLGSCGIRMQGCADGQAVFGIELARAYWGRFGYAQEASEALIGWAFATLNLSALVADTAFNNAAVARLAIAAGFVRTHSNDKQWWRLERSAWDADRCRLNRSPP
jgi:RimJ/RimL family protein N-acetyltransferase